MLETVLSTMTDLIFPIIVSVVSFVLISKYQSKSANKDNASCTKHYIFDRLNSVKVLNINMNLRLSSKGKEKVFKCILTKQIDCILEEVKFLVDDVSADRKKYELSINMESRLRSSLDRIFTKLTTFYTNDHTFTSDDKETIEVVMNRFTALNSERVERLYIGILEVNSSMFYKTPDEKVCAFLDSIISLVLDQLTNAESTFNSINGDLNGLTFNGEVIR